MSITHKNSRRLVGLFIIIALTLYASTGSFAAPIISSVDGPLQNGAPIIVSGSGFGANGPSILIFDDFEGGANGTIIKKGTGSATMGKWDRVGGGNNNNPPKYSNLFSVSGQMAFRGDATISTSGPEDSTSGAFVDNFSATEVYISYWIYWPTTSSFPCSPGGTNCNIKYTWFYGEPCCSTNDRTVFSSQPNGYNSDSSHYFFCNGCATGEHYFSPSLTMTKGKWYRFSAWIKSNTGEKAWVLSPQSEANIAIGNPRVNFTGTVTNGPFNHFALNAYDRTCQGCSESAPTYDDVYVASGPAAQARVEIGDASTYSACKNLALATVDQWSDTSISATIRQGSFTNIGNGYLYVIDANGNVNQNGYQLSTRRPMPPTMVQ